MSKTGIIESATKDLLRWGFVTFVPETGEEAAPTPLPAAPKRKHQKDETQMHRWNSGTSSYDLVTNPAKPGAVIDRTISDGKITIPTSRRKQFYVTVDTEASASSDNLDAILGGDVGVIVILRIKANARTVTVRDNQAVGSDLLEVKGNFQLNQVKDKMMLIRRTTTIWDEVSRSAN